MVFWIFSFQELCTTEKWLKFSYLQIKPIYFMWKNSYIFKHLPPDFCSLYLHVIFAPDCLNLTKCSSLLGFMFEVINKYMNVHNSKNSVLIEDFSFVSWLNPWDYSIWQRNETGEDLLLKKSFLFSHGEPEAKVFVRFKTQDLEQVWSRLGRVSKRNKTKHKCFLFEEW